MRHDSSLAAKERHDLGAHYTPTTLARQIVARALEPHLCDPESVARLRICDPAMGDGIFLVEALRYLAPLLAEAQGSTLVEAKCTLAEHVLFGVDKDPGAVAAARKALAEECGRSVDPLHFVCGDSLVGRFPMQQLEGELWADARWPDLTIEGTVVPHDWSDWLPITCWIGNPPFLGGGKISGTLGVEYQKYLRWIHAEDFHGNADLCAHFFRRADALTSPTRTKATISFIATNTIAQGDTRAFGVKHLVESGWGIYDATRSMPWPGCANVAVSVVHLHRGFAHLFTNNTQEAEHDRRRAQSRTDPA